MGMDVRGSRFFLLQTCFKRGQRLRLLPSVRMQHTMEMGLADKKPHGNPTLFVSRERLLYISMCPGSFVVFLSLVLVFSLVLPLVRVTVFDTFFALVLRLCMKQHGFSVTMFNVSSYSNVFRAYWSMSTSWSLLVQHAMETGIRYDAVVLARPDVWFHVDTDLPK